MISVSISQGLVNETLWLSQKPEDNLFRVADQSSKSGVPVSAAWGATVFMAANVDILVKGNKRQHIFYQCMRKWCCGTCVVSRKWWNTAKLFFQPEKCSPDRINRSLIRLTHRHIFLSCAERILAPSREFVCQLTLPAVMMTEALNPLTTKTPEAMKMYSRRNTFFFFDC